MFKLFQISFAALGAVEALNLKPAHKVTSGAQAIVSHQQALNLTVAEKAVVKHGGAHVFKRFVKHSAVAAHRSGMLAQNIAGSIILGAFGLFLLYYTIVFFYSLIYSYSSQEVLPVPMMLRKRFVNQAAVAAHGAAMLSQNITATSELALT